MTTEIVAFVTALGHASNILKTAIQARDESKRREALSELTSAMTEVNARQLAIQQNQLALLDQNESLKRQIETYDKWEQEKTRYVLVQIPSGGLVYALNPAEKTGDPPHWLCTNCYSERHKSILQRGSSGTGEKTFLWVCPRCKNKIISHNEWPQTLKIPS